LPAIVASPAFELTAVCTTRQESAEESRATFGAKLAFDDWHTMLDHPDIGAVAVVLRVPAHYGPTLAALNAGKHVYTEWPLGRHTAEAQAMAELARARGVRHLVGLQSTLGIFGRVLKHSCPTWHNKVASKWLCQLIN
jgi:predicted dehydrogenase